MVTWQWRNPDVDSSRETSRREGYKTNCFPRDELLSLHVNYQLFFCQDQFLMPNTLRLFVARMNII